MDGFGSDGIDTHHEGVTLMILEEIWSAIAALIVILIYPFIAIGAVIFEFLNMIYITVKNALELGLVLVGGITQIFDGVFNKLLPTPYAIILLIIVIFLAFLFFTRWMGKIEILGFKFGG